MLVVTPLSIDCNEQRVSLCGVEEGEVRTAGLHWRTVRPGLAGNDWGSLRTEEAGDQTEEAILGRALSCDIKQTIS